MITFLAIIHIIACLGLVGLVLIQDSKGGGVFTSQSTSNSVLGATGATSLAQTMTKAMAVVFAVTCIGLSILVSRSEKSVVEGAIPVAAATAAPTDASATESVPASKTAEPAADEKK